MKKRKGLIVHIHLTNRWLYTLIVIGILILAGVGVYAAVYINSVTKTGHDLRELQPCGVNQTLKTNSGGTAWECVDDRRCDVPGSCSQLCIGTSCKTKWMNLYNVTATGCGGGSNSVISLSPTCKTAACKTVQGGCIYYYPGTSLCMTYAYTITYYTCAGACSSSSAATCTNTIIGSFVA